MRLLRAFATLRAARRGATAVEFALVAGVALLLIFAVIELGLLMWTKNALQYTAAAAARCAAMGSPGCTNAQQYAVTQAGNMVFSGIVQTSDVTVGAATTCHGASGKFQVVTITAGYWAAASLPLPFNGITLQATGCYPTS
jgi:Flp pilus assembly protein TadG